MAQLFSELAIQRSASRRARWLVFHAALSAFFVLFGSSRAQAYPWMIKHGYAACSACHSDPSGGELLTAYGRVISDELLRSHFKKQPEGEESAKGASPVAEGREFYQPFFGAFRAPESLLVGGSVRIATLYRDTNADRFQEFPMQLLSLIHI